MCNEGHVADVKAKTINPNHEALPILQTEKKIALTLTAANESADVTDLDKSCLTRRNVEDDFVVENGKMGIETNGTPSANDIDVTVGMEGLLCSDDILQDPNTLASLDDPVEYPHPGTLNQSKVVDRHLRKLKRPTSISHSHRTNKKKLNSRVGPPESKESS